MKYIKQLSINEGYVYLTDRFKSILNDIGIKSDISYDLIRSDKKEFKPKFKFNKDADRVEPAESETEKWLRDNEEKYNRRSS